jgi:hypothetical protein
MRRSTVLSLALELVFSGVIFPIKVGSGINHSINLAKNSGINHSGMNGKEFTFYQINT